MFPFPLVTLVDMQHTPQNPAGISRRDLAKAAAAASVVAIAADAAAAVASDLPVLAVDPAPRSTIALSLHAVHGAAGRHRQL